MEAKGYTNFTAGQLERYSQRYDEIIALGLEQNKQTKGRIAKKEEKALLNRLKKYKENHLLFLYDFQIHFSNNMSEKDLRICKNRQKAAGGFRAASGRQMYFIETIKRRKLNIFQNIITLMNGTNTSYKLTGVLAVKMQGASELLYYNKSILTNK